VIHSRSQASAPLKDCQCKCGPRRGTPGAGQVRARVLRPSAQHPSAPSTTISSS